MNKVNFIPSNFGTHPMVSYNNHLYWFEKQNKNSTYYKCQFKRKRSCGGSISIKDNEVIRSSPHNHVPGLIKIYKLNNLNKK